MVLGSAVECLERQALPPRRGGVGACLVAGPPKQGVSGHEAFLVLALAPTGSSRGLRSGDLGEPAQAGTPRVGLALKVRIS